MRSLLLCLTVSFLRVCAGSLQQNATHGVESETNAGTGGLGLVDNIAQKEVREDASRVRLRRRKLFNSFKSYGDSPPGDRPPQYSKSINRKARIEAFLSPGQKKAMALRYSKNEDFEGVYNGFDTFKKLVKKAGAGKAKSKAKGKSKSKKPGPAANMGTGRKN